MEGVPGGMSKEKGPDSPRRAWSPTWSVAVAHQPRAIASRSAWSWIRTRRSVAGFRIEGLEERAKVIVSHD